MKNAILNIIVIDDNMKNTDPLLVLLERNFNNANIVLRNNAKDGLEYILQNLNSRMIILLD